MLATMNDTIPALKYFYSCFTSLVSDIGDD